MAGLVLAMLLETVLLILRTNCSPELDQKYSGEPAPRRRAAQPVGEGVLTVQGEGGAAPHAGQPGETVSPATGAVPESKKDQ